MERLTYVLAGLFGGIILGFCAGVWGTTKSRNRDRWDSIRTGQFLYDDRVYDVRPRAEKGADE